MDTDWDVSEPLSLSLSRHLPANRLTSLITSRPLPGQPSRTELLRTEAEAQPEEGNKEPSGLSFSPSCN